LEEVLLNVMYDVPSREDIGQVIITAEVVKDNVLPTLVPREKLVKRERRERSA
jgi:ATP-dependent Clp protease ATP-binding subunit ClpX